MSESSSKAFVFERIMMTISEKRMGVKESGAQNRVNV